MSIWYRLIRYLFPCDHKWKGQRMGGPPDDAMSMEWVVYCEKCGEEKIDN